MKTELKSIDEMKDKIIEKVTHDTTHLYLTFKDNTYIILKSYDAEEEEPEIIQGKLGVGNYQAVRAEILTAEEFNERNKTERKRVDLVVESHERQILAFLKAKYERKKKK
jgi:hypothetical protein